jgi:hypothetical protein
LAGLPEQGDVTPNLQPYSVDPEFSATSIACHNLRWTPMDKGVMVGAKQADIEWTVAPGRGDMVEMMDFNECRLEMVGQKLTCVAPLHLASISPCLQNKSSQSLIALPGSILAPPSGS